MLAYLNAENAYADARDGAAQAAAGKAVRGDRRPHQAGRQPRAVPRARLLVLHALRNRQGLSDPRAPQGHDGRGRGSAARRQRDGRGQGLLQRRRLGSQPGQQAAGLGRRRRRPPPVHDPHQEPGHRRNLSRRRSPASRRTWSGPTTTRRCSTSRTIRKRCSPRACKKHVLGTPASDGRGGLRGEGRQLLHGRRRARATTSSSASTWTARCRAKRAARRPAIRTRSPCWRRASATSNTTPTTSAAAG